MYACAKRVFLTLGEPVDALSLVERFDIPVKVASRGEELYCSLSKDQGNPISRLECSELDYAKLLVEQLCTTSKKWWYGEKPNTNIEECIRCVRLIIMEIKYGNRANASKSSKPRTIVSSTIFFHFSALGVSINKQKYASLCGLSPASIDKHHTNIVLYLQSMRDIARSQKRGNKD